MTDFPTRPGAGTDAGSDVQADAFYDGFNQATRIKTTNNSEQHYAYDAFGRRIAAYLITGEEVEYPLAWEEQQPCWIPNYVVDSGRRYIFDGSAVISEQTFDDATRSNATSLLERVHVRGKGLEFTAIDYNNDSTLTNPDSNVPNYDTSAGGYDGDSLKSPISDRAFYYLDCALGQMMGLSAECDDEQMLEYWRPRVFREPIFLGVVDDGSGSGTADDLIEDTGSDLGDNNVLMTSTRTTYGSHVRATSGFGAAHVSSAMRFASAVGVTAFDMERSFIISSKDHSIWEQIKNWEERVVKPAKQARRSCIENCSGLVGGDYFDCVDACYANHVIPPLPVLPYTLTGDAGGKKHKWGSPILKEGWNAKYHSYSYIVGYHDKPDIYTRRADDGCRYACLIAHEEQHADDSSDCVEYARGKADETPGEKSFPRRHAIGEALADWYEENRDAIECRAYCRQLACVVDKLNAVGWTKEKGCKDSTNKKCCNKLVNMLAHVQRSMRTHCPAKADCNKILSESFDSLTKSCKGFVDAAAGGE